MKQTFKYFLTISITSIFLLINTKALCEPLKSNIEPKPTTNEENPLSKINKDLQLLNFVMKKEGLTSSLLLEQGKLNFFPKRHLDSLPGYLRKYVQSEFSGFKLPSIEEIVTKMHINVLEYKKALEKKDISLDSFSLELSIPPSISLDFKINK